MIFTWCSYVIVAAKQTDVGHDDARGIKIKVKLGAKPVKPSLSVCQNKRDVKNELQLSVI